MPIPYPSLFGGLGKTPDTSRYQPSGGEQFLLNESALS
jgi:hypothetical protein